MIDFQSMGYVTTGMAVMEAMDIDRRRPAHRNARRGRSVTGTLTIQEREKRNANRKRAKRAKMLNRRGAK